MVKKSLPDVMKKIGAWGIVLWVANYQNRWESLKGQNLFCNKVFFECSHLALYLDKHSTIGFLLIVSLLPPQVLTSFLYTASISSAWSPLSFLASLLQSVPDRFQFIFTSTNRPGTFFSFLVLFLFLFLLILHNTW